ncbi:hypothetical protein I3843_Q035300 [Carya illinoinensis]|nr:hypothetical protein I3843_Q035300 [Carya illinoinensis]
MFVVRLLLASTVTMVCFATFASGAFKLPVDEVEALRDIFDTLGKNWNFSDPCTPSTAETDVMAAVNCSNCVVNGNKSYRVVGIFLKRQNLAGTLPPDLVKLPCLQVLNLAGNYLNGSIPSAWGSMQQLVSISLYENRVTGSIPGDLAKIKTLRSFLLSSNNFTGELPPSFANLTSLQNFQISDNQLSGQIPSYIQNWKNLTKLVIQASGLRGPIPSLDLLKSLSDLRISDLNGSDVTFPLKNINVSQWVILILRNCNLTGPLPDQILDIQKTEFKILDLSFNGLSGEIPPSFEKLGTVDNIYLTGNLLTGSIPAWILDSTKAMSTLHINCGGERVIVNGSTVFDADIDQGGPSNFFLAQDRDWSSSSTGQFIPKNAYILANSSELSPNTTNPKLYMTARFSPLSLTYYAICLVSGNYKVSLHFAEIVFTDDETNNSLGRRIFDVYIQGERVLQDFDIVKAAHGVRKPNIQSFNALVTNSTLEIRFYWAGKGTTDIPSRGYYGPLISAISVDIDRPSGISAGAVVGILVAGAFVIMLFVIILFVMAILWWEGCLGQRSSATYHDFRDLDLKIGTFTLRQIKTATNNFDAANKIGEGGFGSVYKGLLFDGTMIAVKQLSSKSKQGNREFLNEIGMISALQHPHLVKLYGCCVERNQLLLVYEYMENNSLARALFGPKEYRLQLDWPTRHRICVGIARGLAYLHEESRLKIVHRDIKATNVLLDKNLNPKISDFGMAKLDEEDNTHISTRIAGTYGYMAPEYALHGYLTDKADVYSFGIVALEIVSGKSNTSHRLKGESLHLLDWALVLKEKGNLLDLADPRLCSNYRKEEVMCMIKVALLCTNVSAAVRPTMSSVVSMLEGGAVIPELGPNLSIVDDEMKVKALWEHFQDKKESSMGNSQTQSLLTDKQFTGTSSTSAVDLYPINMDSSYFEIRA